MNVFYLSRATLLSTMALLLMVSMIANASAHVAVPVSPQRERTLVEEEYTPYSNGTPIYYEWEGEWYVGEITHYLDGVYTITYPDDDEIDYVDDLKQIEVMVRAAKINSNPDLFNIGTPVKDGDQLGEIVDYLNSQYRVEWDDKTIKAYSPNEAFDALVAAAVIVTEVPTEEMTTDVPTEDATTDAPTEDGEVTEAPGKYPVGTLVYKDFPDDGTDEWFWGRVSMYEDGMYEIKWSDNTYEQYDEDAEMDQMVQDALTNNRGDSKESNPWDNGTAVYKVFSDGNYFGEIIGYANGYYNIRWSDGDLEEYSIKKTDAMVNDAYVKVEAQRAAEMKVQKQKSRRMRFGMVVLSLGGLLAVAVFLRRRRTQKETSTKALDDLVTFSDVSLDSSSFKDQEVGEPVLDALPAVV
jgi:hypothetical protein